MLRIATNSTCWNALVIGYILLLLHSGCCKMDGFWGKHTHYEEGGKGNVSRGQKSYKSGFHSYFLFLCQVLQYKVIIQLQNANTRMKASFEFEFSEEQKKNNSTCNCTFIACTRPIFHQTWNQIFWKNLVTSDLSQLTSSNISKIPHLEKVKSVA